MPPKALVPLESNPDVFNKLANSLGLSEEYSFCDVFSIDDPDLLSFVPRPVYALILVFPVSDTYEKYRKEQDSKLPTDYYNSISGDQDKEDALWYKQTIKNACATFAILHALTNGVPSSGLKKDSYIDKFIKSTITENMEQRIKHLENDEELRKFHSSVANAGNTEMPDAEEDVELHYVCFTKSRKLGHLVELDGRRTGPVDLGAFDDSTDEIQDILSEKALNHVRGFIQREPNNPNFSMLALTKSLL